MLGGSGTGMQRSSKENYSLRKNTRNRSQAKIDFFSRIKRKIIQEPIELSEKERKQLEEKHDNNLKALKRRNLLSSLFAIISISALTLYILYRLTT